MAKRLKNILIERQERFWKVWCDGPKERLEEITGVDVVFVQGKGGFHVYYDPRYDLEKLAKDIESVFA